MSRVLRQSVHCIKQVRSVVERPSQGTCAAIVSTLLAAMMRFPQASAGRTLAASDRFEIVVFQSLLSRQMFGKLKRLQ